MNEGDLEELFGWAGGLTASTVPPNVPRGTPEKATLPVPAAAATPEPVESAPLSLPAEVSERLFDHQMTGVQWLYRKHRTARACLLADEMGLGKTVQVSVFLGELYRRKAIQTTIVIVPPTLVSMWETALCEWGDLRAPVVAVVHGEAKARRSALWKKLRYGIPCVLVSTYGVLRQDATTMSSSMVDYVVLDEAHLIKDSNTHAFKSALMLSARHKIALTGTPLMNSFEDMWSIFRFLDGSILNVGHADFAKISATLLRGNERDASGHQRGEAESELSKLRAAIEPFMLRREKKDLQGAVGSTKRDLVLWVRLTEVQERQYCAFLETKEVATAVVAGAEEDEEGCSPLVLLTTLSQICNHPWLTLTEEAFDEAIKHPLTSPCAAVGSAFSGAKVTVAVELVRRCIIEHRKALLFSRSKRLLHIIAKVLSDAGIRYSRIDGDLSSSDRFGTVKSFNEDASIPVCLLTTQVGGVGLTFEAASCVVLLDPSWNPSADAQAVDRVHRIGQNRDVLVYRLVTCGTVEEKVYRNQVFKIMAAKQSMMSADQCSHLFRYFTRLQLRSMFEMGKLAESDTAQQLEDLHPGRVHPATKSQVLGLDYVCDVSDNGCVLTEKVTTGDGDDYDEAAVCEGLTTLSQVSSRARGKRRRSITPTSPSLQRSCLESDSALTEREVGGLLEELMGPATTGLVSAGGGIPRCDEETPREMTEPFEHSEVGSTKEWEAVQSVADDNETDIIEVPSVDEGKGCLLPPLNEQAPDPQRSDSPPVPSQGGFFSRTWQHMWGGG